MIKKIFASMLFLVTPMLVQAVEGVNLINADLNASTARQFCQGKHRRSSDSCEVLRPCRFKQAAYFYLVEDQNILNDSPVFWNVDGFTVKSGDIFVNNDPGENNEIIVHEPGVYLITYSVSAENEDEAVPPVLNDTVTFELRMNNQPIQGSKYRAFTQPGEDAGIVDVQQINGQVLVYIPADSKIRLVNVTGVPVEITANRDEFQPTTNDGSVVASIYFQKIADQLR